MMKNIVFLYLMLFALSSCEDSAGRSNDADRESISSDKAQEQDEENEDDTEEEKRRKREDG